MDHAAYWQNFNLGIEIHVAGDFIYNGLKAFHELNALDRAHEVFEVMYDLAVGLERLMKVAVVLIEHKDGIDQATLEESLITHNHQELLHRICSVREIQLGTVHNQLLQMLGSFYKSCRYDRFNMSSIVEMDKEKVLLMKFFEKNLKKEMPKHIWHGMGNDNRMRKFLEKSVFKIARQVYEIIEIESTRKEIFTWELEYDSKAGFIFMGERSLASLDIVWKEALVYRKRSAPYPPLASASFAFRFAH